MDLRSWEVGQSVSLSLRCPEVGEHKFAAEVQEVLVALTSVDSNGHNVGHVVEARRAAVLELLNGWAAAGFVSAESDGILWKLTQAGRRCLNASLTLAKPVRLMQIRDIPFAEMTHFELMLSLERDGWVCVCASDHVLNKLAK